MSNNQAATAATTFDPIPSLGTAYFEVRAGVPAEDALERASSLLSGAVELLIRNADSPEAVSVATFVVEAASALVNASIAGAMPGSEARS